MNTSKIEFKEVMGSCINKGTAVVTHSFEDDKELASYLQENWFSLEEADRIEEIVFELDTEGDFLLDIKILD